MVRLLGRRIGALRREQGLSQAQLATRLGISASAMGMYEQGRREPSAGMLVALARELGVSTDYLLTGQPSAPVDEQRYARLISELVNTADRKLQGRRERPFSRQELTLLFSALLLDP